MTVTQVPWARHDAGHTRAFDDTVGWLAVQCSKTAVVELMRIAWRSVGAIITRVAAEAMAGVDRFAGLRRIGIDEISYKKGFRYLTVVVDHDSRRLIWAAPGRNRATVRAFFDLLGPQRASEITHITADAATGSLMWWPNAVPTRCSARMPSTSWRGPPTPMRSAGRLGTRPGRWLAASPAGVLDGQDPMPHRGPVTSGPGPSNTPATRWKNPENLTQHQHAKLAWIAASDPRLYRAYLLKEGLRHVFAVKGAAGKEALDRWQVWAARCRIPAFVALGAKIRRNRASIDAALDHDLSNALIESTNTKIRLLQRVAFGFKSTDALIALAMLALGGFRPELPGRTR